MSVISVKGTTCKMVELGEVADVTEGQVNIVDPLRLTKEFGTVLADPIIATNVKVSTCTRTNLDTFIRSCVFLVSFRLQICFWTLHFILCFLGYLHHPYWSVRQD